MNDCKIELLTTKNVSNNEPTFGYEKYRRRAVSTMIYFWDNFKEKMAELKSTRNATEFDIFVSLARSYKLFILSDLEQMRKYDGFERWRRNESKQLSEAIVKKINTLQNPANCNDSKLLVCKYFPYTGWGKLNHNL